MPTKFLQSQQWRFASITILLVCLAVTSIPVLCTAQKQRARISLSYEAMMSGPTFLIAKVLTKPDRSYEPVGDVDLTFFQNQKVLGTAVTGDDGFARLRLSRHDINTDSNFLSFSVRLDSHEFLKDAEDEIEINQAKLELTAEILADSSKQLTATLYRMDSTTAWSPVPETVVRFYARRMFGNLPVSEGFEMTEAGGSVSVVFPDDIPGDEVGNLDVMAEVNDHDAFGTLKISQTVDWGVPVEAVSFSSKELWSSGANAPVYLVVIVNGALLLIWGTGLYIVYQLFLIKRLGKLHDLNHGIEKN